MLRRVFRRVEQRWQQRWQDERGQAPVGRIEAQASRIVEGRTPEQVWAFIRPAESAVLTDPDTVRAFTVPGTGPGVGEQQCFIRREGGREVPSLVTVTGYEEAVFAEVDHSSPEARSGGRFEVEPVDGGTRLVMRTWVDVSDGLAVDGPATQAALAEGVERYVVRVKALLEGPSLGELLPE